MSSGKYESQIIEAIQLVVDSAVSKAGYDKTVQGTISRCVDATIGKYIVRYQNSSFYAYSSQTETAYTAGTGVYVLIPANDMTLEKTIIGTVEKLGPDYVTIIEGENGYEVTGKNILSTENKFELCSYKQNETKIVYDRDSSLNLVGLDEFAAATYIQQSGSIICGAEFRTALTMEQQFAGDYGIIFELDFKDNISGLSKTKTYILNIDQMSGNPYNYKINTRQYSIYNVDGENFISVKRISLFQYDFPKIASDKENDIFISNIEFSGATEIDKDSVSTQTLTFITPQGTYFDDTNLPTDTREIQASIRIKGQAIDNESQSVKYYWFIENGEINNKSEKFNKYAGAGWECLNDFNLISVDEDITSVEWVPSTYSYKTAKSQNIAKETTYKCVAVYNNDTILQKTIVIYNYDSNYEISIQSNDGVTFFYDLGQPDLTCYVNGAEEVSNDFKYVWSVVDNNNRFTTLPETMVSNDEYNDAVAAINLLESAIENETSLAGEVAEELRVYKNIVEQYEYIMRVEKNKIHNLKISEIENFSTYKCQVYNQNILIGTGHIIITNTLKNEATYTVAINNGVEIFKYDEAGIAPDNRSLEEPMTIIPLSFELYDDLGRPIDKDAINGKNVKWRIPKNNTMLKASAIHGNPIQDDDPNWDTYVEYFDFHYEINPTFNPRFINNNIQLIIEYKDKIITNYTNFTFTKEGESGTNGTQYVCKIVPNAVEDVFPQYPTLIYNKTNRTHRLNYTPQDANKWFNAELYEDGELIFSNNVGSGDFELEWSILKNHYGTGLDDESNFAVEKLEGAFTFENTTLNNPANIVKCKIKYKDIEYFANLPITVATVESDLYDINLVEGSGFRKVMYTTDGKNPSYNTNYPFELDIFQTISGIKENISLLNSSEFAVDYSWSVLGQTHITEWKSEINLIEKSDYAGTLKRNQKDYKPIDTINGLCVNNAIRCSISREGSELINITIPVHLYINRFGNSAMNDWDGNSISINEDEGIILSPQVGAGYKDDNNAFTGVFMGSVKEAGDSDIETGLFGYNAGQRTVSINAEDGSARFGKTGGGQIVIDPSTNEAVIKSGDYNPDAGTGMEINLTRPSIIFGSGDFSVDENGRMHATGFTTSDELDDVIEELRDVENSIKFFNVELNTNTILIPSSSTNTPTTTGTYNISFESFYKGLPVTATAAITSAPITNITTQIQNNIISFSVDSTKVIEEVLNTYVVKFTYKDTENKTHTLDKTIELALVIQGADGEIGQGVYSIETQFYLSDSKTALVNGTWILTMPIWTPGKYLWTRSKITYQNPHSIAWTAAQCDSSWEAVNDIVIGSRNHIRETRGFTEDTTRLEGWLFENTAADWTIINNSDGYDILESHESSTCIAAKSNFIPIEEFKDTYATFSMDFSIPYGHLASWNTSPLFKIVYYRSDQSEISSVSPGLGYAGLKNIVLKEQPEEGGNYNWNNIIFTWEMPEISEAFFIGITLLGHETYNGLYRKLKLERGTTATDWTPAPEDDLVDAIASIENQYCINNSTQTPPTEDDAGWSTGLLVANLSLGEYLWTRVVTITESGNITYSQYSCLVQTQKEIVSQELEYILSNNDAIQPDEALEEWSSSKPLENDYSKRFLWMRTCVTYKYTGATTEGYLKEYYDYKIDTSWNKLFDITGELNADVAKILDDISGGYVKIEGGVIAIGDDADNPQNLIIINHNGIAFFDNASNDGWPSADIMANATSAWSIDGSLNMKDILVTNLEATSITNQNLVLGNNGENGASVTGDLDIYDRNGNIMFETILDSEKILIDGFKIHKYKQVDVDSNALSHNGYVLFSREQGFGEYDSAGNKIFGRDDLDENIFTSVAVKTEQHIIADTINENIVGMQMIPMEITNAGDGLIHRGIAFIKY